MAEDVTVIFHADDYGANEEISAHIRDCAREGALNSLSILPNSPHLKECMERWKSEMEGSMDKKVSFSIHFNIAEGRPLSPVEEGDVLVDERGFFGPSFFRVLTISLLGGEGRRRLKERLKREFSAQLEAVLPYMDEIRIDSHQHYHMIPVVMESILEVCAEASQEYDKPVTFIRIPTEPLTPYLTHPGILFTLKPINLIKNLVLRFCRLLDGGLLSPYEKRTALFFGITMSGGMDYERVSALLPSFLKLARKRGLPLEVLAHPGGVKGPSELMDQGNEDCLSFYTSKGREREKDMFLKIAL